MNDYASMRSVTQGAVWEKAYNLNNYEIDYCSKVADKTDEFRNEVCAIYFSSSGIYYPNTEEELQKSILDNDYYEWKKHRIRYASKHIFVRDVAKNFYVTGINTELDTAEKVVSFLKTETQGYDIVTVGSSGGAYMAVLAGVLLNAQKVFAFSCFWSLMHINHDVWHLVGEFKNDEERRKYYDLIPLVAEHIETKVIYVYPALNRDEINNDHFQCGLVKGIKNIISIPVKTRNHGVCMNTFLLDEFLNCKNDRLYFIESTGSVSEFALARRFLECDQIFEMYMGMLKTCIGKRCLKIKRMIL